MKIKVDLDRLTLDELIEMEDGVYKTKGLKQFISRFAVDENGEFLDDGAAKAATGGLSLTEAKKLVTEINDIVQGFAKTAVPDPSEGS